MAGCDILAPGEGDFDVDAIPGDYSAVDAILWHSDASLVTPDPAYVFDLEFTADGLFSGHITFPEPLPEWFGERAWGGPPPFDSPVSGTWELRKGLLHLGGANINFLNVLVFDGNRAMSINESGVTPNGELSFGDGECMSGETDWVYQDVHGNYDMTVTLCKKGPWSGD